jgi:hypothetical protein
MTDIQNSSYEQIEQINKRSNKMTTEKAPKAVKKNGTVKRVKMPPAYDLSQEHDGSDELFQEITKAVQSRSELGHFLETIQVGRCKIIGGDVSRIQSIKTSVSNFGKRCGRKFIVRAGGDNGSIVIARLKDPEAQVAVENEPAHEETWS